MVTVMVTVIWGSWIIGYSVTSRNSVINNMQSLQVNREITHTTPINPSTPHQKGNSYPFTNDNMKTRQNKITKTDKEKREGKSSSKTQSIKIIHVKLSFSIQRHQQITESPNKTAMSKSKINLILKPSSFPSIARLFSLSYLSLFFLPTSLFLNNHANS